MRASNKVKGAVLLTAGAALVLGAPTVYADTETGRNDGLLNGLQVLNGASLNVPVNACGVAALLATAKGECESETGNGNGGDVNLGKNGTGGSKAGKGGDQGDVKSSRNDGLLNGAQVGNNLTANVPVNACGVGALLGSGRGKCEAKAGDNNGGDVNSSSKRSSSRSGSAGNGGDQGNVTSSRNDGLLNGVQALNNVSLNVPVNVCGVGLLLADGRGNCESEAGNGNGGSLLGGSGRGNAGSGGDQGNTSTSRNSGLLNGLQLLNNLDANVPVTVCGLAVLGSARCSVDVEAGNRNGGDVIRGGGRDRDHDRDRDRDHGKSWKKWKHHDNDNDHKRSWKSTALPHTGAAGLALLPFGLALVAGGAALRRRQITSQR
ncbi:MAG: hypothetical protein ACT4QF_18945 [Sporichthyaceae bacterium]